MAEVLGPAKKILDLAIAIKRAVDTAKRNERDCRRVEGTVARVCGLLQMLGTSPAHVAMLEHPCVAGALDDMVDSLEEALALVGKCQKKSTFLQFATATGTASKLKAVQDELLRKVSLCTLMVTTMSAVAMTNNRPQLSRQFDIPSSRSELALQLRDTYTNGETVWSLCVGVTEQTRMGVAFALRAAGIDFVIQLDSQQLFGIGPFTDSTDSDPSILSALLAPFREPGDAARGGWIWRSDFGDKDYTLVAEVLTTTLPPGRPQTRRSTVTIRDIDDDTTAKNSDATAPPAAVPLLLPAPVATDSSPLLAPTAPQPLLLSAPVATDSSHLLAPAAPLPLLLPAPVTTDDSSHQLQEQEQDQEQQMASTGRRPTSDEFNQYWFLSRIRIRMRTILLLLIRGSNGGSTLILTRCAKKKDKY